MTFSFLPLFLSLTASPLSTGEGDFQPIDVVVTFETEETEKTQQILIFDDRFLEEPETFFLVLEPINNLDEGAFPVVVIDDTINIIIIDNDGRYFQEEGRKCKNMIM